MEASAVQLIEAIPKAMLGLVMMLILFLPILMVPYIFIKMGSVAGKIQASLNGVGRGLRKGAGKAVRKEGKAMAGRAWQSKSAEWANRDGSGFRKRVGGYKAQRDFAREQRSAIAGREQQKAVGRRLGDAAYLNSIAKGNPREAQRLTNMARNIEQKDFDTATGEAASNLRNFTSDHIDAIAQGRMTYRNSSGQIVDLPKATAPERVAAAQWVMENGNFNQRQAVYESMTNEDSDEMNQVRKVVNEAYYKRGDNKVLGSAYGGMLQEGVGGNDENGIKERKEQLRKSLADTIKAGKIGAAGLTHDADATKLVVSVAQDAQKYGLGSDNIVSLQVQASEAFTNPNTRPEAIKEVYSRELKKLGASPSSAAPSPSAATQATQPPQRKPIPPGASGGLQGDHTGPNDLWIPKDRS